MNNNKIMIMNTKWWTNTKCMHPAKKALCIFILLFVSYVFFAACSSEGKIETNREGCDGMIDESLLLHEIKKRNSKGVYSSI